MRARHSPGSSQASCIVVCALSSRTESVSVRARSSQLARSKIPGSRSSQRPCVSSMSPRDGVKTSKTKRPPGASRRRAARTARRRSPSVRRCGSERNGQSTSGTRFRTPGSQRKRRMNADQEGESTRVDWQQYENEALQAISAAATAGDLDDARVRYLGRKSELAQGLRGVRDRESGMLLNGIRERLEAAVEKRREAIEQAELQRRYAESTFDVTLPGSPFPRGRLHVLTQIQREIEDIFLGMGYEVYEGDEVTDVWHNFDALTTDQGHPSRSPSDTFYLSDEVLLRTH